MIGMPVLGCDADERAGAQPIDEHADITGEVGSRPVQAMGLAVGMAEPCHVAHRVSAQDGHCAVQLETARFASR